MADGTKIEWTDATWNPITGCQVKSPGCKFCYAMKLAGTRLKHHPSRKGLTVDSKNGPVWTGEVRLNEAWLTQPLHWTKPRMIFVCAHADLFYEAVPDEWIDRVFAVMTQAPQHVFQLLTKRPDRMLDYLQRVENEPHHETVRRFAKALPRPLTSIKAMTLPSPNIWLGTSVEDQAHADERRNSMRQLSGAGWKTWASYEPTLGVIHWGGWEFLDWIVSGGESDNDGRSARPSCSNWHRVTRDFCAINDIAYLFKQWGAFRPCTPTELNNACGATLVGNVYTGEYMLRVGKKQAGRCLDGVEHNAMPAT
ncbi:phage Gp37/Gp68 family protein [Mesorhizobium neociceri]|uniref:Phage Gp37/Gp68 family protein n=1 Tax=Mesorhizobium neociceri TaxID=1307853 RepID=A0A838B5P1_9HYPH|nr:phage Gp37/Gp68 family protein [Mesorhizobium neociceri]MBA1141715.1 phage Gp37/Gp68 family protein [Mesorhizobium neociceri]